jgi:hypothetical protein
MPRVSVQIFEASAIIAAPWQTRNNLASANPER